MVFVLLFGLPAPFRRETTLQPIRLTPATTTIYGGLTVEAPSADRQRPKIGVALAGGGAKAAASIDVLKVLRQEASQSMPSPATHPQESRSPSSRTI
jgi:hypothetical protein